MRIGSSAIDIPRRARPLTYLVSGMRAMSYPNRNVLYGGAVDSYIPLQQCPMPASCPDYAKPTSMIEHMSMYFSSDSEDEDQDSFDGTFDPNNPVVARIFENVAKHLLGESI